AGSASSPTNRGDDHDRSARAAGARLAPPEPPRRLARTAPGARRWPAPAAPIPACVPARAGHAGHVGAVVRLCLCTAVSGHGVNPQLRADILARLTGPDYQGVVKGQYVQRIACPDCHKREAYTRTENPWMIYCGRMDKCGAAIHVKDQFAEYFDDWSARYAPVNGAEPAPNAVADGYLRDGRGFDLRHCRGHYTQEYHHDQRLDIGSPTVRFTLPGGATWERIIDAPWRFGKKKAVFRGDYKGDGWQLASDAELVAAGEVWLVEGIFDCIALAHHGIGGVSAMSCVNFPALVLERLKSAAHAAQAERPTLVWALDANRAGRDWAKKHARRAEELGWTCRAAQPPHGLDWYYLHQRGVLGEDARTIYRYYGDLR